jgi:membrane protease YdiL (CAAX protease family)
MRWVKLIFWNETEGRLAAGWRLYVQLVLNLGLAFFLLRVTNASISLDFRVSAGFSVVTATMFLLATLASVWLAGRFLDRRRFSDFGFVPRQRQWWADLAAGLVTGCLMAAGLVLLALAAGWVRLAWAPVSGIAGVPLVGALVLSVLMYGCIGLFEELTRAYQERNLLEGTYAGPLGSVGSTVVAVAGAALVSVVMHRGAISYLLYVFVSAMVLGLFYLLTGRMALATGTHMAYDFAMFAVFGVGAEEGSTIGALFLVTQDALIQASEAGMAFTPRGLVLALGMEVAGLLLMLGWVRLRTGRLGLRDGLWRPTLRNSG